MRIFKYLEDTVSEVLTPWTGLYASVHVGKFSGGRDIPTRRTWGIKNGISRTKLKTAWKRLKRVYIAHLKRV